MSKFVEASEVEHATELERLNHKHELAMKKFVATFEAENVAELARA
jgi:hypothetical protein